MTAGGRRARWRRAVAYQFQVGRGLEEQGFGVLGVAGGGPFEAGRFGGVVDVLGGRVGAHERHGTADADTDGGKGRDMPRSAGESGVGER